MPVVWIENESKFIFLVQCLNSLNFIIYRIKNIQVIIVVFTHVSIYTVATILRMSTGKRKDEITPSEKTPSEITKRRQAK